MRKFLSLTIILTLAFSVNIYAYPQYSAETQKLMQETGIEYNVPLDEVMRRQETYKKNKANKSTPSQNTAVKSANNPNPAIPNQDKEKSWGELRINSNYSDQVYYNPDHGSRMEGFDEFRYVWELN